MRWLKRIGAVIMMMGLIALGVFIILDETLPVGVEGVEAEALADNMLSAINYPDWKKTGAISWDFGGRHQHLWDKDRHLARVTWDDFEVLIDISNRQGVVTKGSQGLEPGELSDICFKAWKYWANDSFWLNPIAKVRDTGTKRMLVNYRGKKSLLVSYMQGGVTPGDSYLWILDEQGLPTEWRMWVNIIPIGGISTTWEGWIRLSTGAMVSTIHHNILTLKLSDVQAANNLIDLTGEDSFQDLFDSDVVIVSF